MCPYYSYVDRSESRSHSFVRIIIVYACTFRQLTNYPLVSRLEVFGGVEIRN